MKQFVSFVGVLVSLNLFFSLVLQSSCDSMVDARYVSKIVGVRGNLIVKKIQTDFLNYNGVLVLMNNAQFTRNFDSNQFAYICVLLVIALMQFNSEANATSDEWSKRWSSSESRFNSHLTQANLIKLGESQYYQNVGDSNTYIQEQNNIENVGQKTNTIGSVNTSTNNITVSGNNVTTKVENAANTNGNVNGSITSSTQSGNLNQCLNLGKDPKAEMLCN